MPAQDLPYAMGTTRMIGRFAAPEGAAGLPGVLVVHGAQGLTDFIACVADRLAAQGHAVLAVDLWGDRQQLRTPSEIGARLAACAADRAGWMGRIAAARAALAARPEVDAARIAAVGYCFGGASVLEYARLGHDLRGVVALHPGLEHALPGWGPQSRGPVLICTGAADPLAPAADLNRLTAGMDAAGIAWETDIYGGVRHGFTEPDFPGRPPFAAYDADADRRSWAALSGFLAATLC